MFLFGCLFQAEKFQPRQLSLPWTKLTFVLLKGKKENIFAKTLKYFSRMVALVPQVCLLPSL